MLHTGPAIPFDILHTCTAGLTAELKASEGAAFKHTGVMRALGAEWGALADRSKYEALAAEDKARCEPRGIGKWRVQVTQ